MLQIVIHGLQWLIVVISNSGYQFFVMVIRLCMVVCYGYHLSVVNAWLSDVNSWSLFLLMSNSSYSLVITNDFNDVIY